MIREICMLEREREGERELRFKLGTAT